MPNCGIIDMGSNTIRLSIYQYDETGFKLLLNKKEMAGLAGYVWDGILTADGIQTAIRVLSNFRALLNNLGIEEFYVFATAALRNVANTDEAVSKIEATTGIQVVVISGTEEAALSFQGALFNANEDKCSGLLVDIGGGSTELVAYERKAIQTSVSIPIGSLSLYTQHVSGLFPTDEESKEIRRHVRRVLPSPDDGFSYSHLRGVGGTIRAVGKLCAPQLQSQTLPAQQVRDLYHRLKKGDKDTLHQILRCTPDRVHTLLPGLIILNAILKTYQVETMDISTQGVREGYLLGRVLEKKASQFQ